MQLLQQQLHPKFYFFDVGVYRVLRKKGPLDSVDEIEGSAIESLVFQELRAINDNLQLDYELSYWRTTQQQEVDFVLYGPRGFWAIEVKRSSTFREKDLASLELFLGDYPQALGLCFYTGDQTYQFGNIKVMPLGEALLGLDKILS